MFTIPINTKNCFWEFLIIEFPIIAAWPAPIPGRKLQRGAERSALIVGFINFIFGFVIKNFLRLFFALFFFNHSWTTPIYYYIYNDIYISIVNFGRY